MKKIVKIGLVAAGVAAVGLVAYKGLKKLLAKAECCGCCDCGCDDCTDNCECECHQDVDKQTDCCCECHSAEDAAPVTEPVAEAATETVETEEQ